jgi:hypothetical protein
VKGDDKEKGALVSYGVDTNWYTNSGATHHLTDELNKLSGHDKYKGQDRVHTADGNAYQSYWKFNFAQPT